MSEGVPVPVPVKPRRFRITVTELADTGGLRHGDPRFEEREVLRMEMGETEFDAVRAAVLEAIRRGR